LAAAEKRVFRETRQNRDRVVVAKNDKMAKASLRN
jgi:hypothetical protein